MPKPTLLLAAVVCFVAQLALSGQSIVLDSTFGNNGVVTHSMGSTDDKIWDLALQPNQRIVAAGFSHIGNSFVGALSRYTPNGALDTSFAGTGMRITQVGSGNSTFHEVALQTDGKLVAAGYTTNQFQSDFLLARYNTDGSADTTFGTNGLVITDFAGAQDAVWFLEVLPNGHILAGGVARDSSLNLDFALARYLPNGTLDTTFGSKGKQTIAIGSSLDFASAGAVQPDGKILLCGYSNTGNLSDFALVRLLPNGTLDTTFGQQGKVVTAISPTNDQANAIALQPDGKILVSGFAEINSSYYSFALVRYQPNGNLDSAFGTQGIQISKFGAFTDYAQAIILKPDGKIIVGGSSSTGLQNDMALAQYLANGQPDSTFGTAGKMVTPISNQFESIYSMQLQADGKLVCGGFAQIGNSTRFALMRFTEAKSIGVPQDDVLPAAPQVFPNPGFENVFLTFSLREKANASILVYAPNGQLPVVILDEQWLESGMHRLQLPMDENLSQGMYIIQLRVNGKIHSYAG